MSSPSKGTNSDDDVIQPMLYVDVNIGPDKSERIIVYEGDSADELALEFCE